MRQKKVWRYYCDHCGKGKFSRPTIEKHERGCTLNPNRRCGLCFHDEEVCQAEMPDLIAALAVGMDELRKVSSNCPACILAAIRQAPERIERTDEMYAFRYQDESAAFWNRINDARAYQ